MRVCGIDPGLEGGITFLDDSDEKIKIYSYPMPTVDNGHKNVLSPASIHSLLSLYTNQKKIDRICIEKVGAMPGQGVTSMFSFGYGAGVLEGIVASLQIPYMLVIPQTWMKAVLSGLPKNEGTKSSIIWCQRFFPHVDWRKTEKSKKPHDGKTDSACIAWYALKNI